MSSHNFRPETKPDPTPSRVRLVDITGRVIEQLAGIALHADEKVALAGALSDAGIEEMHPTLHVASTVGQRHMQAIAASGCSIRMVALVYSTRDVEIAAANGAAVAEVVTVGRPSLHGSYRSFNSKNEDELIGSATERISLAKKLGLRVRADINLIGYSEDQYIKRFVAAAREAGADEIQIADGSSSLGPRACAYVVGVIRATDPSAPVALHLHNDFGLAVANAIAALEAGAESFDVSINGIGERAGQLDLAQWALVLRVFYEIDPHVRFNALNSLSRLVEDLTRSPVPGTYPIVGEFAFDTAVESVLRHEFGIDDMLHAPIAPEFVGAHRQYPLGRNTGRFGLMLKAHRLGIGVPDALVPTAIERVEQWFESHKRPIDDRELRTLLLGLGCHPEA